MAEPEVCGKTYLSHVVEATSKSGKQRVTCGNHRPCPLHDPAPDTKSE